MVNLFSILLDMERGSADLSSNSWKQAEIGFSLRFNSRALSPASRNSSQLSVYQSYRKKSQTTCPLARRPAFLLAHLLEEYPGLVGLCCPLLQEEVILYEKFSADYYLFKSRDILSFLLQGVIIPSSLANAGAAGTHLHTVVK